MITHIVDLPSNIVGFKATGVVTENDFKEVVLPTVKQLVKKTDQLNYMLVLDTSVKNFNAAAWVNDTLMGIKYLTNWNRAAIISDLKAVKTFTDIFSKVMPGEFRVYEHKDQQEAVDWVAGTD